MGRVGTFFGSFLHPVLSVPPKRKPRKVSGAIIVIRFTPNESRLKKLKSNLNAQHSSPGMLSFKALASRLFIPSCHGGLVRLRRRPRNLGVNDGLYSLRA